MLALVLSLALGADGGTALIFGPPTAVLAHRLDCPSGTQQETAMDYRASVALHRCVAQGKPSTVLELQAFDGALVARRTASDGGVTCTVERPATLARSKFRADFAGCR